LPPFGAQSSIYDSRFAQIFFLFFSHALGFCSWLQWIESPRATEGSFEFSLRIRWLILLWLFPCWTIFVSGIVTLGGVESSNYTTCRV
jgi:hypothetical protein